MLRSALPLLSGSTLNFSLLHKVYWPTDIGICLKTLSEVIHQGISPPPIIEGY